MTIQEKIIIFEGDSLNYEIARILKEEEIKMQIKKVNQIDVIQGYRETYVKKVDKNGEGFVKGRCVYINSSSRY